MNQSVISFQEKKIIPDAVLGMIFLLAAELMFFSGLISAFVVNKTGAIAWPPAGQPRLPVEMTAINSFILVMSGVLLFLSEKKNSKRLLSLSILSGVTFLLIQGSEWVKLLGFGLSSSGSIYGAFFYVIIGAHGLHVLAGLALLIYLFFSLQKNNEEQTMKTTFTAFSLYWYFVVAIWIPLYVLVYLNR